jgi:hypothetical protein
MSAAPLYFRRLAVMLGIAMPVTVVLLGTVELAGGDGRDALSVAGGAAGLVYVWGVVTGTVVSLAHTALLSRKGGSTAFSVVLGLVLGLLGGAVTPTVFTGMLEPAAIGLGGFAGLVYGCIVAWQLDKSNPAVAKVRS